MISPGGSAHSRGMNTHILMAAQRGDEVAWESLVDEWLPVVHGWCTRLGGPRVDPNDATQDVFVIAWTKLDTMRNPDAFPSWLFSVTRRVMASHRRRQWLSRWVPGMDLDRVEGGASPERGAHHSEIAGHVQDILQKLPQAQREALVLCDVEGRSSFEVAQILGIPAGTVRSRLRLGRARFRKEAEACPATREYLEAS